jgi:hypothetical protein
MLACLPRNDGSLLRDHHDRQLNIDFMDKEGEIGTLHFVSVMMGLAVALQALVGTAWIHDPVVRH